MNKNSIVKKLLIRLVNDSWILSKHETPKKRAAFDISVVVVTRFYIFMHFKNGLNVILRPGTEWVTSNNLQKRHLISPRVVPSSRLKSYYFEGDEKRCYFTTSNINRLCWLEQTFFVSWGIVSYFIISTKGR